MPQSLPPLPRAVGVFAPATVANIGPGFDILGLAVSVPHDVVYAERVDEPGVFFKTITGDGGRLSRDPKRNTATIAANYVMAQLKNTATIAANHVMAQLGLDNCGVALSLEKGLPLESGLGSSAASA